MANTIRPGLLIQIQRDPYFKGLLDPDSGPDSKISLQSEKVSFNISKSSTWYFNMGTITNKQSRWLNTVKTCKSESVGQFQIKNLKVFFYFFILVINIWRVQNSDLLNTKMPLILLLVWITVCMCTNCDLFHWLCSKNEGETTFVLWITACEWRIPTSGNLNCNSAVLWRIFSSNESAPANKKKGFYTNGGPSNGTTLKQI